jgi:hypothetical protein
LIRRRRDLDEEGIALYFQRTPPGTIHDNNNNNNNKEAEEEEAKGEKEEEEDKTWIHSMIPVVGALVYETRDKEEEEEEKEEKNNN